MATKQVKRGTLTAPPAPQAPAPQAPAPAPTVAAPTVALRGGAAVATVQVKPGVQYRTKAPHNLVWWQSLVAIASVAPAPVAQVCKPTAEGGSGVPAHFVGYCLRRGYLQGAAPVAQVAAPAPAAA